MADQDELAHEVKYFIVQELACFKTPSEVAAAVKDEFEIAVTRQRVHRYDPTKKAGADLSDELKQLFEATRKALIDGAAQNAIEHRSVRLKWLNDMAIAARSRGNMVLAAQLIEQAAKECGEVYSNRHKLEHTGKDGKDLPGPSVVIYQIPDNGRDPELRANDDPAASGTSGKIS